MSIDVRDDKGRIASPSPAALRQTMERFADEVSRLLDAGLTTREIAADLGVEYDSIVTRLRRSGQYPGLHRRILNVRREEWDRARIALPEWHDRKRCEHGAWSTSGDCEHGRMGRYAKEAA